MEGLEARTFLTALPSGFTETTVVSGLQTPTAMEFAPDGRLFVLEKGGDVRLVRSDGTTFSALHLTVDTAGERGLLGIAFDPDYASNHFVYLYFTNPNAGGSATGKHNQISRFTVNDGNLQSPVFADETPILDLNNLSSASNHNGGAIHFGADGMLYVGVGENANPANAQSLGTLLGKFLRVNVDGYAGVRDDATVGHIIPADNPFVGTASGIDQLIYALGLRNPFTFSVQPGTGRIFINDVGQNTWEEIDDAIPGSNYGWNNSEGFKLSGDTATTIGAYRDPLLAYNHTGGPAGGGVAIVGGVFYNPPTTQFPASFVGKYFYEDLVNGWIRVFDPANPGSLANPDPSTSFATGDAGLTVDLKIDAMGSLYYLSQTSGRVERISFQAASASIDAGGSGAGSYQADADFKGGQRVRTRHSIDTSGVADPAPQSIYQSLRSGNLTYTVPHLTPGGSYSVRLDFSENNAAKAGRRAFNVSINGSAVLSNFNVFTAAGGRFKAITKTFTASADASGRIALQFHGVVGAASVAGITITKM